MASCENPGLLEKAGVDGRSVDRLWLRSVSRRAKTMRDPRHWFPSLAGERQEFERTGMGLLPDGVFQVSYLPDIAADGRVEGFCVMVVDVTARKPTT